MSIFQQEPKDFIRVILALSLMQPHELGWDPSMRLMHANSFIPSHDKRIVRNDYCKSLFDTHWAITTYGGNNVRKRWFTIRALSVARTEVLCGRATVVWEVVELSEDEKTLGDKVSELGTCVQYAFSATDNGQVHTLKQSWQPIESNQEGEIHNGTGLNYVRKMTSWGDIMIDSNTDDDDTTKAIRNGVLLCPFERMTTGKTVAPPDSRLHDLTTQPELAKLFAYDREQHKVVNRVLHRQIMGGPGWTIKFFADLPELLRVLQHAIEGT